MPTKKVTKTTKSTKKTVKVSRVIPGKKLFSQITRKLSALPFTIKKLKNYRIRKRIILIAFLFIVILMAFLNKQWFIAATVNGSPITNFELLSRMNQTYREQTLNQMINERLITQEAIKNGVIIKNEDIDSRLLELEGNVGGAEVLDNLLSQQGQTRQMLKEQIKLQLMVEKLYENEATVSAEEVKKFVEENKDRLQATESAKQEEEAQKLLKQQKLSQTFSEKFQTLKDQANIQIF